MRSVLARFALLGIYGIALTGCGTNGAALAPGAVPNDSGGGTVPLTGQNPPGTTIPGVLIDGGVVSKTNSYSGINTTATDVQDTIDAGTDPKTSGSGTVPADPTGAHAITFAGSGASQIIFGYNGAVAPLYYTGTIPGQLTPVDYGAIVLYAGVTNGATPPLASAPKVAIELTGGSNFTTFDVRSTCGALAIKGTMNAAPLIRYVCALPAYGAVAGTTGSVTLTAASTTAGVTTPAVTTSYIVDTDIANPRIADTSGSFTPAAAKLYVELIYASNTAAASVSTGNVLSLDYVYAEAGTK